MAVVASGELAVHPDLSGFESKLSSSLGGIAKKAAVAFGGAFAATKALDFFSDAVGGASDLAETVSKANTIFGDAAGGIEKWAGGAATALGQSKQQALDAAATFGNMFSQLGLGSGVTADMSKKMVTLASDFASFHNADISEVLAAQTAAFRGEFDAVQRFVPTINAAAVEQRALADSGKKTTKELTLQEKALATQALLMEGAGKATGDFARTSDGLANKQRILSAKMADLKTTIGSALLPVVTKITTVLADNLAPAFAKVGDFVKPFVVGLQALVASFQDPDVTSNGFVGTMERLGVVLRDVFENQIKPFASFLLTKVVPAVVTVGGVFLRFGEFLLRNIDTIKKVAAVIGTLLIPHFIKLGVQATISAAKQVAAWVTTKAQAIAAVFASSAGFAVTIAGWVASAAAATAGAIAVAAAWLISIAPIAIVTAAIVALVVVVVKNWDTIRDAIVTAATFVLDFLKANWPTILAIITGPIGLAILAVVKNWDTIKAATAAAWDFVRDKVGDVVGWFQSVPGKIASATKGMWDGILSAFKSTINSVIGLWNRFVSYLKIPAVGVGPFKTPAVDIGSKLQIPKLHEGGLFKAPFGQSEGLALLRNNERVLTPGQSAGVVFGPGSIVVQFNGPVSDQQAYAAGQALGAGAMAMARRELRRAARVA